MSSNATPILRVLLVEDSAVDGDLIVWNLKQGGYQVIHQRVETEAALELALDEENWDAVICDYSLPKLSALRALRIVKQNRDLPFIIVSGVVDESIAIEVLKAGASDFISKDKLSRLVLVIRRELRSSGERMEYRLRLEESYERTIEAWGKALELRDHFTAGHTQRVTDLTLRLARRLDVNKDAFADMHRGALLHDVGKMGIPDAVLLKPEALDVEEWRIMKMHPKLAYEMLSPIPFFRAALNIPYCHHEKWDGSGYPRGGAGGMEGRKIPFEVRIFSVVDVYDALTSDRAYRKSWEKEKALAHIQESSGTAFDPAVVDSFLQMMDSENDCE